MTTRNHGKVVLFLYIYIYLEERMHIKWLPFCWQRWISAVERIEEMTGGEGQDLLIRVSLPISFGNITPLFSGSSLVLSSLSLYIYKRTLAVDF